MMPAFFPARLRLALFLALAPALAVSTIPSTLTAQQSDSQQTSAERARAATVLPATTWAMLHVAGIEAAREAAGRSPLLRYADRTLDELVESGMPDARIEIAREIASELRGEFPREILGLVKTMLEHGFSVAVDRPTFGGGIPMPSVAVVVPGSEGAERVVRAAASHYQDMFGAESSQVQGGSGSVRVLRAREPGVPPLCIARAESSGHWLVGNSPYQLLDCLEAAAGDAPSLADHAGFRAAAGRMTEPALVESFVNLATFSGMAAPLLPYEAGVLGAVLGCEGMQGVYLGVGLGENGQCQDLISLAIPGARDGLLRTLFGQPVSHRAAKYCPADAVLYATMRVDCDGAVQAARKLVEVAAPALVAEFDGGLEELCEELADEFEVGRDRVEALLTGLGDELTVAVPNIGGSAGLLPQAVAFLSLKDPDLAVVPMVRSMFESDRGAPALNTTEYRGTEIAYFTLHGTPVTVAFAVRDSMLMLGSNVLALKRAIAQADEQDRPSLAGEDDFSDMAEVNADAAHLIYGRIGRNIEPLWRTLQPFAVAGIQQATDGEVDPLLLPESDEVREMIGDVVLQIGGDAEVLYAEQRNRTGLGVVLAASMRLLGDALDLAMDRERRGDRLGEIR